MRNGCGAKASGKNRNQRKPLQLSNKLAKGNSPNAKAGNNEAVPSRSRGRKVRVRVGQLVAAQISQKALRRVAQRAALRERIRAGPRLLILAGRTVRGRERNLVRAAGRMPEQMGR